MICPECGGEYREGFYTCADCEVPLVEGEAAEIDLSELPEVELVTVLESNDPTVLPVAESLLMDAGIQYLKAGEALQRLFGGSLGYSSLLGLERLQVAKEDAEAALELLSGLAAGHPADPLGSEE